MIYYHLYLSDLQLKGSYNLQSFRDLSRVSLNSRYLFSWELTLFCSETLLKRMVNLGYKACSDTGLSLRELNCRNAVHKVVVRSRRGSIGG